MERSNPRSNASPPLLATNLPVPSLHRELISRHMLVERMDQALEFPLTLISAPAGFGKTTLLSQWVSGSKNETLYTRTAWILLEGDCDLIRFWMYIVTALKGVQPEIGESILDLFNGSQPPIHTILRMLINEISGSEEEFVLILDDYP